MKIRPRLVLTIVVVAVPLIAGTELLRAGVQRRAAVAELARSLRERMESGGREECEACPASFHDPSGDRNVAWGGARVEIYAYGSDFVSANASAPPFPPELRRELEAGARDAGRVRDGAERREITAAARMAWETGPCVFVLARRSDTAPVIRPIDEIGYAAAILFGLVFALYFAIGPVERRVSEMSAASVDARVEIDELRKRESSLRTFVENTTHDVMIPLTVIQGHLLQMRDSVGRGAARARRTLVEALEEVQYLSSLVANLVAATKLDAGELAVRRDTFSWSRLVERVVLRHATVAREKGVELDLAVPEADVTAAGDVTLVEQALSNVVHNAVRYNRPGGHATVVLEESDARFSVRVIDDGPGVSTAELARLAERSYRGDAARSRHPDGTGLGLSIAKDVADRSGFELTLRASEAGGLEVEISGPVAER